MNNSEGMEVNEVRGASSVSDEAERKALQGEHKTEPQQTRLLKTFLVLAVIYTLYLAKSLFIPLVFSAMVALLLSPLVTLARKFYIPRAISAVLLICLLVAPFTLLGVQLAQPAERWLETLPKISAEVTEHIDQISDNFDKERQKVKQRAKSEADSGFSLFGWFKDEPPEQSVSDSEENVVSGKIKQGSIEILLSALAGAPLLIAQMFGSVILILFLLVFGPTLFSVFVKDFPVVSNKKRAIVLVDQIQTRLSNYILTISMINGLLGLTTAATLYYLGVEDALLWGALVGFLNFVPYLGGMISTAILVVAGVVQYGFVALALLPAFAFLILNIIESQFITPAILGQKMRVNPLVIIIWLSVMGWLWGVIGVLLAVPLLVCFKIVLEQIGVLSHWVKLIESGG